MPLKLLASLYGLFLPADFYKPLIDIGGKKNPIVIYAWKKNPKSYELTTVLLYRKNNTLVTLNNGCQNLLILVLASGFIIVENLSAFFFLFLWVLWLHQFWTMSSLVFPQGSSSSYHVKYLIHLNRLMFAKVEKMSQNLLLDRRLAHLAPGAHRKFGRLIYSFREIIW